jgi:hypothetical protein
MKSRFPKTAATLRSMANLEQPWQRRDNAGYWVDRRDMYAEALKEAQ